MAKGPQNIAVVNIEWSDDYAGGDLHGYYGGAGNEKYTFAPVAGKFYGYVPPNGRRFPKQDNRPWLVFFISRPSKLQPTVVVGWFERATFTGHLERPDTSVIGLNGEGEPFTYSVSAERAITIPAALRDCVLPKGRSLRAYCYVRSDGVDKANRKALVRALLTYRDAIAEAYSLGGPEGRGTRGGYCLDTERRKAIEKAAVKAVKREFESGFTFCDRQSDGCGYDLQFTDQKTGELWCIEVKGTSGSREVFFISPNERNVGRTMARNEAIGIAPVARWRLGIVTNATDRSLRRITYYTSDQLEAQFDFSPTQWQVTQKSRDRNIQ